MGLLVSPGTKCGAVPVCPRITDFSFYLADHYYRLEYIQPRGSGFYCHCSDSGRPTIPGSCSCCNQGMPWTHLGPDRTDLSHAVSDLSLRRHVILAIPASGWTWHFDAHKLYFCAGEAQAIPGSSRLGHHSGCCSRRLSPAGTVRSRF